MQTCSAGTNTGLLTLFATQPSDVGHRTQPGKGVRLWKVARTASQAGFFIFYGNVVLGESMECCIQQLVCPVISRRPGRFPIPAHGFSPDLGGHRQPSSLGSQAAHEQPGASLPLTWSCVLCELQKVKIIPCRLFWGYMSGSDPLLSLMQEERSGKFGASHPSQTPLKPNKPSHFPLPAELKSKLQRPTLAPGSELD